MGYIVTLLWDLGKCSVWLHVSWLLLGTKYQVEKAVTQACLRLYQRLRGAAASLKLVHAPACPATSPGPLDNGLTAFILVL